MLAAADRFVQTLDRGEKVVEIDISILLDSSYFFDCHFLQQAGIVAPGSDVLEYAIAVSDQDLVPVQFGVVIR